MRAAAGERLRPLCAIYAHPRERGTTLVNDLFRTFGAVHKSRITHHAKKAHLEGFLFNLHPEC